MTKLIFDCDPGVDDAIALFLAFASPELELLAITTTAGNVSAALTARNAAVIRQIGGREDVPIFAGAERPLVRPPVEAGDFHGASGLGPLELFQPAKGVEEALAPLAIIDLVMRHRPGEVSIAVTGPCTNLALAMRLQPAIIERLGPVVVMGGARREGGNITPSAEFNIFADPHAAQIVFSSGAHCVVMGLDVTHQVRADAARTDAIARLTTPGGRASAALVAFSNGLERDIAGGSGAPLHDPCVIAYMLDPQLFTLRPCELRVETCSPLTLGHTAVEFRPEADASTIQWATAADADAIFALLTERLAR